MRLVPDVRWRLDSSEGSALDGRLIPLLEAIAATGSLSAAVATRGLSYRAAWGLLRDCERTLGAPLAQLQRGRGAQLAPAGERLVHAQRRAEHRLAESLSMLAVEVGNRRPHPGRSHATLPVAASHDLALAALRDAATETAVLALDIAFTGSLGALQQFSEGRVALAGFHVALGAKAVDDVAPFRRWLNARRDRLVRFVDREQGLFLPRGNPARVRGFVDIARKGLRFVNRQRGSGTRLLIDRLAAAEGIRPETLTGYAHEEFTHPAVAATVASGAADAGFGLRAAAAEHGLVFVSLVRERYYLAVRAAAADTDPIRRLLSLLRGREFARIVRGLPGYIANRCETVAGVDALGEG